MRGEGPNPIQGTAEPAGPANGQEGATRRGRAGNNLHSASRTKDYLGLRPSVPWAVGRPSRPAREAGSERQRRRAEPVDVAEILRAADAELQGLPAWRGQRDERLASRQQRADGQRAAHLDELNHRGDGRGFQTLRSSALTRDTAGRQLMYQRQLAEAEGANDAQQE